MSEEGYEDEWQEDEWNENYDGYWADDQTWNEGYWAYDDLYYMDEYEYFQKKGKGKGKKGKKGKDDDGKGGKPGDGKGKSNYVQPQTTSAPAIQNQPTQQAHYSSAASSSGHGFFSFGTTEPARVDVAETEPARVDVLTRMQHKMNNDVLVVEDRTNVMQEHIKTGEKWRDSLFWLEKLVHYDKVYNNVQL